MKMKIIACCILAALQPCCFAQGAGGGGGFDGLVGAEATGDECASTRLMNLRHQDFSGAVWLMRLIAIQPPHLYSIL